MIDRHSINNQRVYALGHERIMPNLSRVKQIGILRTPGSTSWGVDAGGGIIDIITLDWKDVDDARNKIASFKVTADYELENRRHFQDVL